MDLNRVTVFARVVEEGSFTRAAQLLGLPKSSVSRSISLLEEELGARLLQRTSRKVAVTEAGAAYYAEVGHALATIEEANARALEQRSTPKGTVRITAPFDASTDILVPLVVAFHEKHPAITIDLSLSNRAVDLVEEGFDFGLRGGQVRDQSLIVRKIAEVKHGLFASRAYVERRGQPSTVASLAEHDCVLFKSPRGRSTWTLLSGGAEESAAVHGGVSVDDLGALRSAVVVGAGIGLIPPMTVHAELASGAVVRVLPQWTGPSSPFSLVYPSARLVPQRAVLVREYLLKELALFPWGCTEKPAISKKPRPR